jgi:hypothetical protein
MLFKNSPFPNAGHVFVCANTASNGHPWSFPAEAFSVTFLLFFVKRKKKRSSSSRVPMLDVKHKTISLRFYRAIPSARRSTETNGTFLFLNWKNSRR